MKPTAALLAISTLLALPGASAVADVHIDMGSPPPLVFSQPPEFLLAPGLGFYIAVGVPYDLFFISNRYYLRHGEGWYEAPYYNGPWAAVTSRTLPPGLLHHPYKNIRAIREREYRLYREDGPHYRGEHFRPEREWREERREFREDRGPGRPGEHSGNRDGERRGRER